jgi:hypothetical protein
MLSHLVLHPAFLGLGNPFSWLTGHIAGLAVDGFNAIVKALFAPIAKFIDDQLIGWLVTVPNFNQGQVSNLEQTVEAIGGGLLGAVATISVVRYWAAGLAGGGGSGFEALEGLGRSVSAALLLAIWPWGFDTSVHLTNLMTGSLLHSGTVTHDISHLLAAGVGASLIGSAAVGLFIAIVGAVVGTLLFFGLMLLKLVVSVSTLLLFVGMPLAIVASPLAPWLARAAVRAFVVCLIVPVLWVLCFACAAAVADNSILFEGSGVANVLLQPMVAIMLLYVMVKLPSHLAKVAMLGAAPLGGGMVSRAASYAVGSQMRNTVAGAIASRRQQPDSQGGQNPAGPGAAATRLKRAATVAGAAATGGAAATAAGGGAIRTDWRAGRAAAANPRSYTRPPNAPANAGATSQNGLQTPSFRQGDFEAEQCEAEFRATATPVSPERAREALESLPTATQQGVAALVSRHGDGAREHLAYQATGDWTAEQREALRDLAAATPEVRAGAITAEPSETPAGQRDATSEQQPVLPADRAGAGGQTAPAPAGQPAAGVEYLPSPQSGSTTSPPAPPTTGQPPAGGSTANGSNGHNGSVPTPKQQPGPSADE